MIRVVIGKGNTLPEAVLSATRLLNASETPVTEVIDVSDINYRNQMGATEFARVYTYRAKEFIGNGNKNSR